MGKILKNDNEARIEVSFTETVVRYKGFDVDTEKANIYLVTIPGNKSNVSRKSLIKYLKGHLVPGTILYKEDEITVDVYTRFYSMDPYVFRMLGSEMDGDSGAYLRPDVALEEMFILTRAHLFRNECREMAAEERAKREAES